MKRYLLLITLFWSLLAMADNGCDVSVGVYFGDESTLSQASQSYLKNTILKALAEGKNVSHLEDSQFGIVVKTDVVDKHIIEGAPAKTVLNLSMTLFVGDVQNGELFSSWTTDITGVGNSETKAYNNAIHKLNSNNRDLINFASNAKKEIIAYYDRNYTSIIKKAEAEASVKNYEEAIYRLMCIPECCKGYDTAMSRLKVVYQQYIDQQCHENLAKARSVWMSGFNKDNASVAGVFLSEIYPDAACYGDAMDLMSEIKNHMGEEWRFKMKQWDDLVGIESQRLKYARDIAIAFAQNQPRRVIYHHWWRY